MPNEWSAQYKEHNGLTGRPGVVPNEGHETTSSKKGPGCGCDDCITERKTAGTI